MLSTLASNIRDDYYFVMPKKEIVETFVIKRKFYESLAEKSIPHPRVLIPTSFDSMRKLKKEIQYPVYIRPSISPKFAKVFKKKGFIANTEKEIDHYYSLASKHKIEVMFQEIVYGPDTNHYGISGAFNRKGKPLALFGYHRLRGWPVMFGNSSLMESMALSELSGLKNMIVHYLGNLGYYGIMDAEFKKDIRDGQFRLLEVNARSWWQNYLPTKCGQNIVLKAYLDAIGENVEYKEKYAVGTKWVDLFGDLRSAIQSGEIGRKRWFRSFRNVRAASYFDASDPLPFFARLFCIANELL
jgi:predicted ATP-grasp superfamily ATP-dependent carboligase